MRSMSPIVAMTCPPFTRTAFGPSCSKLPAAAIMSSRLSILVDGVRKDRSNSASNLFGVIKSAIGNSSLIMTSTAFECRRVCPDVETQTGSQTRGGRVALPE